MPDIDLPESGLSRRDAIRRGAVVGGSLLWATPVVQSLGGLAHAQEDEGSPKPEGDCIYYAIKVDANGTCDDSSGSGNFDCLESNAPHFGEVQGGGCAFFHRLEKDSPAAGQWTVLLAAEVEATSVEAFSKCAKTGCQPAVATDSEPHDTVVFFKCPKDGDGQLQDISNAQLVFCVPEETA